MTVTVDEVEALCEAARRYGVEELWIGDVHIRFSAAAPTSADKKGNDEPLVSPVAKHEKTLCGCGHDLLTEHAEVGCLHGCPEELCVPDEEIDR